MIDDKELNQRIIDSLDVLPGMIAEAERKLAMAQGAIRELKDAVNDAELDAELFAEIDGRNAEERKLQRAAAIQKSPAVIVARKNLMVVEADASDLEVNLKEFANRFKAALALAELQAARMNLLSKYK